MVGENQPLHVSVLYIFHTLLILTELTNYFASIVLYLAMYSALYITCIVYYFIEFLIDNCVHIVDRGSSKYDLLSIWVVTLLNPFQPSHSIRCMHLQYNLQL